MDEVGYLDVAVSDHTSFSLRGALGINFALAGCLGILGLFAARGIRNAPASP